MTSRTISGLIEAGASGFESAANYLDLPYSSISEIASALNGFFDGVGQLADAASERPNYWDNWAKSHDSVAQYYKKQASTFAQKMVANPNNRVASNAFDVANQFAERSQALADAARANAANAHAFKVSHLGGIYE